MVRQRGECGGGELSEGEDRSFDARSMFSRWGCVESDAQGTEWACERCVDFLAVAMKGVDTMLVGVVGGSNDMLKGFKHCGSRL